MLDDSVGWVAEYNDEVGWVGEDDGTSFVLPGKAEVVSIAVVELVVGTGSTVKDDVWAIDSSHVVLTFPDGLRLALCWELCRPAGCPAGEDGCAYS